MNAKDFLIYFLPRIMNYKLVRRKLGKNSLPVTFNFAVTNKCQSKCKTCNIWTLYRENPEFKQNELKIEEIEKIFKSLNGHIYFFNITGGEPFLRNDIVDIVKLASKHLKPRIIHIPTNGLAPKVIEKRTKEILKNLRSINREISLTVKPSLDGIGEKHDQIRGIPGNFEKVLDTVKRLKKLRNEFPNFYVELGTVISKFNLSEIDKIAEFVQSLDMDNYRNEIAEQRAEFFNLGDPITPSTDQYQDIMKHFKLKIKEDLANKRKFTKITQSFRLVYYDLVGKIMSEKRQVIPCYAGITTAHLSPTGEIWPCCMLGSEKKLGNLREVDYDFKKIWRSKKAAEIRQYIKDDNCHCPLANQAYNNILCDFKSLTKVFKELFSIT